MARLSVVGTCVLCSPEQVWKMPRVRLPPPEFAGCLPRGKGGAPVGWICPAASILKITVFPENGSFEG